MYVDDLYVNRLKIWRKTIYWIANVDSDRRKLLCISSTLLVASNLCWIINMGVKDCKSILNFISVLIGFGLNGYFSWFYWQRNYDTTFCLESGIAFIVGMIPAVLAYFFSVPKFLRFGPKSYICTSTTNWLYINFNRHSIPYVVEGWQI